MRKLLLSLAVLSVIALPVAGCGSEDEAASGATELVPAGALVYAEATLDPDGDQKEAIDTILSKFPGGGETGEKLKDLIEKGLRESDAPISFKKDIEPWLGDEAAFFATSVGRGEPLQAAAGVIATDDEDAARAALEKSAEGKTSEKTYRDVDYLTDESGEAGAVFDGFLVLGSETGVKASIDASKGDSKLSDDEGYRKAIEGAADDRLGLFYVNMPELVKTAQETTGAAGIPDSFKKFFKEPLVATVDADKDGVAVEAHVSEELANTFGVLGAHGSDLLNELPADSWVALAQPDLGHLIDFYVDAFAGAVGGRDTIEQQFKAATGLDLQRDLIAWMGDFGIFARGTSVENLDGALVIETSDEAASGRFIAALERLAKSQGGGEIQIAPRDGGFTVTGAGIPKPVHLFQQSGRVVLSYGDAAAKDAIDPGTKLGDDPDFTATRDSLGDYDVSFYVLLQPIFDLVDSTETANDADWQKAKPYLEPLSALVAGTSGEGDDLKSAFKIVVK
jgi:hypothetical protein